MPEPEPSGREYTGGGGPAPYQPGASPSQMKPPLPGAFAEHEPEPPWYTPGARDLWRAGPWRWVGAGALALVGLALVATIVLTPVIGGAAFTLALKLGVPAVLVSFSLFSWTVKKSLQGRREPFCIHCGYDLSGLEDDGHCPECGRHYQFALIDEYRRDPAWFRQRWKAGREVPREGTVIEAGIRKRPKARDGAS